MKNKNITIEDLARMVGEGFDSMDKGFNNVDRRFDGVDKKFKEINARLNRIENIILKQYSQKIEILERRMKHLEEALAVK